MIEELEVLEPFEFLRGECKRRPGRTLFLAPEFTLQMVNFAAGFAGSRDEPCAYINTYGGEGKILPDYVVETLRLMAEQGWIDGVTVLGMTERALENMRGELKRGGVRVDVEAPSLIERYDFPSLVKWIVKFIRDVGSQGDRLIIAYDEPLSALLSAKLKAFILPIHREMEGLPKEYREIIGEYGAREVMFIAHARDVEESWRTQKILRELEAIQDLESRVISGDMFTLSREANLAALPETEKYKGRLCFVSGANEIPILTPLAVEVDALIIRCGYDNFDIRFQTLLHELQVGRCVITEAPDRIGREDLDTWFYISTRARGAVESILGARNVYRLWANWPRDMILRLMEKYSSLDTMAHVLYWGLERKIMETMFKIA